MTDSDSLTVGGAAASGAIGAIAAIYRFFVPRGEAKEYRRVVEANKLDVERRLTALESDRGDIVTRKTLEDVIEPIRDDLRDIKVLLRGKK